MTIYPDLPYQPYFYIIQEIETGIYYAGSKYSQKKPNPTHPSLFMIEGGYTTSSETINQIIAENGLESFRIRKLRVFDTKEQAVDYETRFLIKVDARNNPRFHNGHNNDGYYSRDFAQKRIMETYGVDNYAKTVEFPEKFREASRKKYGVDHHLQNPEIMAKQKRTNLERWGVDNVAKSQQIKDSVRHTKQEKYGNPNFVNPDKATETNLEKYGVKRPTQIPEVRQLLSTLQEDRYSRVIVDEIKALIVEARSFGIDCGKLGLKRMWWQNGDETLVTFKKSLEDAIEQKKLTGYVRKTKSERLKELNATLYNRPIVKEIQRHAILSSVELGPAWWRKSDEVLEAILESIKRNTR
jgi:hypothetical protein